MPKKNTSNVNEQVYKKTVKNLLSYRVAKLEKEVEKMKASNKKKSTKKSKSKKN